MLVLGRGAGEECTCRVVTSNIAACPYPTPRSGKRNKRLQSALSVSLPAALPPPRPARENTTLPRNPAGRRSRHGAPRPRPPRTARHHGPCSLRALPARFPRRALAAERTTAPGRPRGAAPASLAWKCERPLRCGQRLRQRRGSERRRRRLPCLPVGGQAGVGERSGGGGGRALGGWAAGGRQRRRHLSGGGRYPGRRG